jgi:metal-dependent amidase/aminoacylase/carboxypeptidase family protein
MTISAPLLCAALLLAASASPAYPQSASPSTTAATLLARINRAAADREAEFIALRHDLHRHPEISGNEVRTAGIVAARMRSLGLEVRTGVGGHGVVAVLRGGRSGPIVAYRADMDAVPSSDPDPVEYRSVIAGVRHVCGHDMHTAIAIALATSMASVRAELPGTVVFIFQPAEERATGARAMLDAGIFAAEQPVAIYGLHTAPYQVGEIGSRSGGMLAARDAVNITLTGAGDIAAAVTRVRAMLTALNTITNDQQFQPAAADFVFLQLFPEQRSNQTTTVRASITLASATARENVMRTISSQLSTMRIPNVQVTHSYQQRQVPGVTNDSSLTATAMTALRSAFGAASVHEVETVIPAFSEDFGAFQQRVPGTFFFLGVSNSARGTAGMPHAPSYVADDGALLVGVKAMSAVILDRLARAAR